MLSIAPLKCELNFAVLVLVRFENHISLQEVIRTPNCTKGSGERPLAGSPVGVFDGLITMFETMLIALSPPSCGTDTQFSLFDL